MNNTTVKYTNIHVWNRVNCSSSGHYTAHVTMTGGPSRYYSLESGFLSNSDNYALWETAPAYLEHEVKRQLIKMIEDNTIIIYENDRNGCARTENLRYHEPDELNWFAEYYRKSLGE